jgi:putative heme-binding domain-containing protein
MKLSICRAAVAGTMFTLLFCKYVGAQPLIAETPALTPAEEVKKLHVPPGFEVQLVASEPEIHKPINLKFDAHGRLWVTHTIEYPFPAKSEEAARDAISIFSSFGADGKAQKTHRFAEHLSIPIGVVPLSDTEAIGWSIPNIWRFTDTNGDGVADKRTVMFGPFGVTDTHGDQNAFTRWIDGWIYANHGFSNDSHVKIGGTGPDVLHMNSGNTYRFRPDGSAIEQYSWGQVNPFGLSFDPLGNLFSADCHSSAVTLLLREGYYQSFGKPHDGLGFAPEITHIDHGGTGIAGVTYSTSPNFPKEYRDVLFVGNVITNRVHCDRLTWTGSTPTVIKVEDFLTSDDPWFRPVDIQPGPDGALYVADFYNCIIGHYEVPLTNPKRDRERGRIWRVVYKGDAEQKSPSAGVTPMKDLPKLDAKQLFAQLRDPNLTVRVLATNQLLDAFPKEAATMSRDLLLHDLTGAKGSDMKGAEFAQPAHAIWILKRTEGIPEAVAHKVMAVKSPAIVQVHLVKALGETAEWKGWQPELVRTALENPNAFVRRAAAEALSKHPAAENLSPLLDALAKADQHDTELYHEIRIAIRDQIRSPQVADKLLTLKMSKKDRKQLVDFAATAPTGPAALLIFDEALHGRVSDEVLVKALPAAARYVDRASVDAMIANIQKRFAGNTLQQVELLQALADGLQQRGLPLTDRLRSALTELLKTELAADDSVEWCNIPLAGAQATASPWAPQIRAYNDGNSMMMMSSLPAGEQLGGTLRSPSFELPAKLGFWMCGHDGLPNAPPRKLNFVRLVLDDGTEVARTAPPRDDIARRYEWDLTAYAGRHGHVEVVDGITDLTGFAWIAVSRFEPAVITLPEKPVGPVGSMRAELIRLAGQLKLAPLAPQIEQLASATNPNLITRLAATEALITLEPKRAIVALSKVLSDTSAPTADRQLAAQQLARIDLPEARATLLASLKSAPESVAILIAAGLGGHRDSAESLLKEIREGRASATLLREASVVDRLKASGLPDLDKQIADLTANLSPADDRISKLIAERKAGFLAGKFDPEVGKTVFAKSVCANCHKIGDVGKTIGPGLDGIGNRGLDRLLEDSLDPNRNVDLAFRVVMIETEGGQVLSGFGLREEGETLVFNDSNGQQVRLPKSEVAEKKQSALSPMPGNVIEQMPEKDYYALLAYLLSLNAK